MNDDIEKVLAENAKLTAEVKTLQENLRLLFDEAHAYRGELPGRLDACEKLHNVHQGTTHDQR